MIEKGQIGFFHGHHAASRLIQFGEKRLGLPGYVNHVAIGVGEGMMASAESNGTVITSMDEYLKKNPNWKAIICDIDRITYEKNIQKSVDYALSTEGIPYDYSAITGFAISILLFKINRFLAEWWWSRGNKLENAMKYFCSELGAECIRKTGIQVCNYVPHGFVTPSHLLWSGLMKVAEVSSYNNKPFSISGINIKQGIKLYKIKGN